MPFCHLWLTLLYNIFPNFHINGMIKKKKVTDHKMCVLILSTTFVWNISDSQKKWATYDKKWILVFAQSTLYSCPILTALEFSWKIFEKILKYQTSWKYVEWQPSCSKQSDRWMDGHDEANSRFAPSCGCALKWGYWLCSFLLFL
jgi:hypothetical protein